MLYKEINDNLGYKKLQTLKICVLHLNWFDLKIWVMLTEWIMELFSELRWELVLDLSYCKFDALLSTLNSEFLNNAIIKSTLE